MEDNKIVDNHRKVGYNDNQLYDKDEIIDLTGVPPLNDIECLHQTIVADLEDTIGDAIYHGCQNPKCGRGWYIRSM